MMVLNALVTYPAVPQTIMRAGMWMSSYRSSVVERALAAQARCPDW